MTDETVRSIFTLNGLMNMLLSALMILIALVERYWAGQPNVAAVLLISSARPLLAIFEFVPAAYYQREMNYGVLSRVGIACTLITAVTVVACAASGLGALSPAIGPIVAGVYSATYYTIRRRRDMVLRPTRRGLKPAMVFGFQLMSISGVAQITQRLSDLALGRLLGIAALGLYSRASNLSMLVFSNIYGQATGIVFVKLSRDLREKGSLHETFLLSLRMITAFIWPLVIGIAVLARPLIYYLYGEKWVGGAPALTLLMVAQFVVLGFGMNWELFVLRRETARQTRFEAIRAVVGLGAFVTGCMFSITAAAAGRVAEAVVGYFLYRPHMDRLAGAQPGELERVFAESAMLTAIATIPAAAVMIRSRWAMDTSLPLIIAAVALGVGAWFATLILRDHPLYREVKLVAARLRRQRAPA